MILTIVLIHLYTSGNRAVNMWLVEWHKIDNIHKPLVRKLAKVIMSIIKVNVSILIKLIIITPVYH